MGAITVKGQVTIAKRIRDALGMKPEDQVSFDLLPGGEARLRAAALAPGSFEARLARLTGSAGPGLSTDEIMALTRGDTD